MGRRASGHCWLLLAVVAVTAAVAAAQNVTTPVESPVVAPVVAPVAAPPPPNPACDVHRKCFDWAVPNFYTGVGYYYYDPTCEIGGTQHCVGYNASLGEPADCRLCKTPTANPNGTLPLCPDCVCQNYGGEVCIPYDQVNSTTFDYLNKNPPFNGTLNEPPSQPAPPGADDVCFAATTANTALGVSYLYYDSNCLDGGLFCTGNKGCRLCKLNLTSASTTSRRLLQATVEYSQPICPGIVCSYWQVEGCLPFAPGRAPPPPVPGSAPPPSTRTTVQTVLRLTGPAGKLIPFDGTKQGQFAGAVANILPAASGVTPTNIVVMNANTVSTSPNDVVDVTFTTSVLNARVSTVQTILQQNGNGTSVDLKNALVAAGKSRRIGLDVSSVSLVSTTIVVPAPAPAPGSKNYAEAHFVYGGVVSSFVAMVATALALLL
eukprot:jgi/Chlat1/1423/Chrsp12S01983